MVDKYDDGRIMAHFESIPAMFRVIKERGWTPEGSMASDIGGADGQYLVFDSLHEAHDVFLNQPWRIRQFSQKDDKLRLEDNPGNDVFYSETGDFVDVGRFLEGEPENFGNSYMGNPARVFAEINVNIAAAKWTTAEYILQKQKRILRLVDWLETYGIRCRIRISLSTDAGSVSVTVKDAHEAFDVNALAIAMHPDFLRRSMFLVLEQSDAWEFGYGDGVEYDDMMLFSDYCDPADGFTIYVGGYMPYSLGEDPETRDGYNYDNDVERLDKDFDNVEVSIAKLIKDETRFTEKPLKVGAPYVKLARTNGIKRRS